MEIFDAMDLLRHWRRWPPVGETVKRIAVGLGVDRFEPEPGAQPLDPGDPSGIAELLARAPDGRVRAG